MVDSPHQLTSVLSSEIIVVGTFKAKEVAFFLIGHAEHETGEVFIRMLATDLLLNDEAAFIEPTVEDDEALHLAQFRLCDVECNLIVAILLCHAFSEESLPLCGIALRNEL